MATLPGTRFTEREPPGETGQVTWGPPPETGGQEIVRAIGKFGTALANYFRDVQEQKTKAEYYEKKRLIDEAGWAAHNAVRGDKSEEFGKLGSADQALWDKFQTDAQAIISSSEYKENVNDLMEHLNQVSPNWYQGMYTASLKIQRDNAEDQLMLNWEQALENNDKTTADNILDKLLELKGISQAKYEHLKVIAPSQTRLLRAEDFMAKGDYKMGLEELKATDNMDLTTEQLQQKRSLKAAIEQLKNERAEAFYKDTLKKILAGGDSLKTLKREDILNHPDLSGPQMNTLINLYDSRVDGAGKAYSNQQKLAAYAEIVEEDDPAKKLQLLFKHAGAFTPEKAQSLYDSITNPTTNDFEDSNAAKFFKELVDDFGRHYNLYEKVPVMRQKGYRLIQDAIDSAKSTGKPLTEREKQELALRIFNNLRSESITTAPETLKTPEEKAKGAGARMALAAGAAMLAQGELAKTGKSTEIPQPKTQAEFEQTVKQLARSNRSQAKTYYDKWVSKWQ